MPSRAELPAKGAAAIAVLAGACAAGMLPSLLPVVATLTLAAAGVVALMLIGLRRALATQRHAADPAAGAAAAEDAGADSELRLPRLLFYGGCLLLAMPKWRVAGLTLAELAFIAAFAICLLSVLLGRAVPPIPTPLLLAVGTFFLGGTLSSLNAQSPPASGVQLVHALYVLLLWPVVAAMVLRTRRQLLVALTLWTVSGAFEGFAALAQALGVHALGLMPDGSRMTGFTPHPNDLGGATAVPLVVALMLASHAPADRPGYAKLARWLIVILCAAGVPSSGSITAMAAAGGALLLWLSWPSTRTASNLAFVVAVFCALTAIAIANPSGSSPVTRLAQVASPTAQSGGSLQDRVTLAQQAWPRIRSDPIVGAGLDTGDSFLTIISHTSEAYYQLHGLPLAAWYQGGIFALLGLLGVLMAQAVLGWRGVRAAADPADAVLGLALLGAFLAFVVEAMTMPLVFQQYSWAAAALLFAWSSQVAMSRRAVELETEAGAVKARGAFASSMPLAATLSDLRT